MKAVKIIIAYILCGVAVFASIWCVLLSIVSLPDERWPFCFGFGFAFLVAVILSCYANSLIWDGKEKE